MSWLKSLAQSLSRSSALEDDFDSASEDRQTPVRGNKSKSLKKSSSLIDLQSTTPTSSPDKSLRRSNTLGSVRSILKKKASMPSFAEAGLTPSRSVKFTASTSEPAESMTPVPAQPASYHFDDGDEPYFYKSEMEWSGKAEVIVDSPPPAATEHEDEDVRPKESAQRGDLLHSLELDQISPLRNVSSNPGTPALISQPKTQAFLNRLKALAPSPEASLLASSTASSNGMPSLGQANEWSNLFETSLPHQHGLSSSVISSASAFEQPRSMTQEIAVTPSVALALHSASFSGKVSTASASEAIGEESLEQSFTTPGKAALNGIRSSISANSLVSMSTPGASPDKTAQLHSESKRSLNTKVNMLKRDGDKMCDEFGGLQSPEQQFSTPATSMKNKKRRSSVASPSKQAALDYRAPPLPYGQSPAEKSVYLSPEAFTDTLAYQELPSPIPSANPAEPHSPKSPASSMDITDSQPSPSQPRIATPPVGSSLSDLLNFFSSQHLAFTQDSAKHRSIVADILRHAQRDAEAKDKRLVNLQKQVALAQQGWEEAIEEAGRWEEEVAQFSADTAEVEQLRSEKKDLEIRLRHLDDVYGKTLEKAVSAETLHLEIVKLRAEVDRTVQDSKDAAVNMRNVTEQTERASASRIAGLTEQLQTSQTLLQAKDETISSLEQQILESHEKLQQAETDAQILNKTQEAELKALRLKYDQAAEEIQNMKEEEKQQAAQEELTKQNSKLHEQLERQNARIDALQKDLNTAYIEIARLEEGNTSQLDRVERSQSKIGQLESGQELLVSNIHDLEDQLEEKNNQLQQLTEDNTADREEADARLEQVLHEAERLKQDLDALQEEVPLCHRCGSADDLNIHDLQEENNRLSKLVAKLRFESSDRDTKIARLSKAKADLKEDKEGLSLALEAKQQELSMLKRRRESRDPAVMPFTTAKSQRILRSHPSLQNVDQDLQTPMPNALKPQASTAKRETLQPRRISFGQATAAAKTSKATSTKALGQVTKKNTRNSSVASLYDASHLPEQEKENTRNDHDMLADLPEVPRTRRTRVSAV